MNKEFSLPIKGVSEGLPVDKEPPNTSGYMNNVRPFDVLEQRLRLGQRPGLDKAYSQQIASIGGAIVAITSVAAIA